MVTYIVIGTILSLIYQGQLETDKIKKELKNQKIEQTKNQVTK